MSYESYVSIQWGWITLLVTVVCCGVIFLLLVIFMSSRSKVHIWKSSSIAPLLALDRGEQSSAKGLMKAKEMDLYAGRTKVQFRSEGGVWHLES